MTCKDCGMTIGWDCECDPSYNQLVEESGHYEGECPCTHGQPEHCPAVKYNRLHRKEDLE